MQQKRQLMLLGIATCILPFPIAAAVGWWSAWPGVAAGSVVSIAFGVLWSRRAGTQSFLLGIVAGLFLAGAGGTLTAPSLRTLSGNMPPYELGNPPPSSVELVSIPNAAPRSDLLHVGPVFEFRTDGSGTQYKYSVVSPVVPPGWDKDAPVPAWVICEMDYDSMDNTDTAKRDCRERFAGEALIYEREGFDSDLPNEPMVAKAMATHDLSQEPDAPIFRLWDRSEAWASALAPLLVCLLALGALTGAVNKHTREPDSEIEPPLS